MVSECGRFASEDGMPEQALIAQIMTAPSPRPPTTVAESCIGRGVRPSVTAANKRGPRASGEFQSANLAASVEDSGDHFTCWPATSFDDASCRQLGRAG